MKTKIINKISTLFFEILALIIFGSTNVTAAPGDLDPEFGAGGKVITVLPDHNLARKSAIQSDGKIVVSGISYPAAGTPSNCFLARYNPNGTLDTGFGTGGTVIIPFQSPSYEIFDGLAILPDGKILVAGSIGANSDVAVLRLNSNGSRDTSFGTNGTAVASFGFSVPWVRSVVQVQADGKIVVVDSLRSCDKFVCSNEGVGVVRFNNNGTVDTGFGAAGTLRISNPNNEFIGADFKIYPGGKLLLVGNTFNGQQTYLSRINANGTLDESFGANGILQLVVNPLQNNYVLQLALQPDGRIVFPTFHNANGQLRQSSTVVRLNPNGTFDASFGKNGKSVIPNPDGLFGNAIQIQPNGKILAAGLRENSPFGFVIVRLNADGSRDTSFGVNGIVTTVLALDSHSYVNDLALQPDGKLVAYGDVRTQNPDQEIGLARYLLNVPHPPQFDFDGDGRSDVSLFRQSDRTWYVNQSTAGFSAKQFGLSTDKLAPSDFDGDGKTDIAVFRDGGWYLLRSQAGFLGVQFGMAGDIPQPADFDGDGKAELSVYRAGTWYTFNLTNSQINAVQFGIAADRPVVGDYDGDGRADCAVYRDGTWYLLRSTQGFTSIQFGLSTDKLVPADYDGDGRTDIAVYRDGTWYQLRSQTGFLALQFGVASDIPVPADYDGDRRADPAVYRDGVWYLRQSTAGTSTVQFGLANDMPVPSAYLP